MKTTTENALNLLVKNNDTITALRREIHAYPELGFEEFRTSDLVAKMLTDWGLEVHRGIGGTGLVGVVRSGNASRAIGLRADMDALPIQELNTFEHASRHAGKMHACGHDGHTAMLLAAAHHLAANRDFDGTVYLIFQPAEESGGGAKKMMDDGLFEKFPMEAVFGMHNWPGLPAGTFALSTGPVMASSSEFRIALFGKGGHAALPHTTLDPIPVACQLVTALQSIVSRNLKPIDAGVVSVTMMHAGLARNVIADMCELQGTVRTFSTEVLDTIERRMQEISENVCAAHGLRCEFEFDRKYPPTINTAREVSIARQVMDSVVGSDKVLAQEPAMAAEDFSYMLQAKPGAYCFIGSGNGDHRVLGHGHGPCTLHNPSYDFNDDLIPVGATYWVRLVQTWLSASVACR